MKHFLIEITDIAPIEAIQERLEEHRAFLQTGYEKGWLLLSGPTVPRTGGVIIGRAPSLAEMQDFFEKDPYRLNGLVQYRYVEFLPVKHQPFLADWTG